jgi:hypothetical protein
MTTVDSTIGAQVLQAPISFSAPGDNIVVAGITGKSIKVLQLFLVLAGATNLTYKSGSTPLSGLLTFGANAAQVQDYIQLPLTCNVGDNFIMNLSAGVVVGGAIWYSVR